MGARPIVLVTGANGFVGRHLIPILEAEGWLVRWVVRQPSGIENEIVIDTIGASTDWSRALDGVDAVIHLAARVHHAQEERAIALYYEVNIEGTLHLARRAMYAGVKHFVFVSTVLVHGRGNDGRPAFSENDVLTPRGLYGWSKAAAESGLRLLADEGGMRVTVIRPPLVYGYEAKGNFALLVNAVKRRMPLPFAAIRNQRAFVSVQNLSSFILWRLNRPEGRMFEVFLVADQEQVSTPEFIRRLARAAGSKPVLFPAPSSVLSVLLTLAGRSEARHSLIDSLELDLSKAAATGWRPPLTMDDGLRLALRGPNS